MKRKVIEFLAKIVGTKSVSSKDDSLDTSNKVVSEIIADMLSDFKFNVEMQAVPDLNDKYNVIASIGPEVANEGLLLAGHTDTVPFKEEDWDTNPLELTAKDNKLYGMGACDMKSFFATIYACLLATDLSKLRKPLRVWATANEECGMEGANFAASNCASSKYCLVGEPTNLVPIHAHKGGLAERIVCIGKQAHASDPSKGINALEAAAKIMVELRKDIEDTYKTNRNEEFTPPHATMNFGFCQSGNAFNTVPDKAEFWVDRRLLPGENPADIRKHIKFVANDAISHMKGIQLEFTPLVDGFSPVYTPVDSKIIKSAAKFINTPATTVAFGTEAPYYVNAGMDTLIMGAGDVSVVHQANEYVPLQQIEQMIKVTSHLISKICINE